MAVTLAIYKTQCDLCSSTFNTTTALMRHRESKHHIGAGSITFLPFYNGEEVVRLPSRMRTRRRSSSYKQWISGIVASINSCLHPKAAGMYLISSHEVMGSNPVEVLNFSGFSKLLFVYHFIVLTVVPILAG